VGAVKYSVKLLVLGMKYHQIQDKNLQIRLDIKAIWEKPHKYSQ